VFAPALPEQEVPAGGQLSQSLVAREIYQVYSPFVFRGSTIHDDVH
jgi:hypothetical protein